MDPGYVDAVLEFFIRLFHEGQIYRGWRVINWCPRCHSAISDIEVEDEQREDRLYYLRYPLTDGSGDVVVATVRPETILGDVAVAVHPNDERYQGIIGKTARLPLLGRELAIVADPMVETAFGTGAVKITPAHDFADFEVAQRHGLAMPIAIDVHARITDVGEQYQGLTVSEARQAVLRDLEDGGYFVKSEPYQHLVPTCERCGTLLEPLLSEQWFMRMDDLVAPAIDVVNEGRVQFVPDRWSAVYLDWMGKIRPWTLSRQLWWGHRIPVYYCANGHAVAAKRWPDACTECGADIERQDPDVLDTWFSSALWPFATLGWPHRTDDLERYYPTSFMNTSSQILYLWIARMIMTGLKFENDVPFPLVLINPTILNKHGQRMSKSLGTGIDPLDLVRDFGADALRFGLMTSGNTHQQDIRFSPDRVEQARNFANKVWNVARFILGNQSDARAARDASRFDGLGADALDLRSEDRWILSRLNAVIADVTDELESFEFNGAGQAIQEFVWSELADWYVEVAKLRLFDDDDAAGRHTVRAVLWSVLERCVRLLHPYMPFLTEEIWQHARGAGSSAARELSGWGKETLPESIMVAPWPSTGPREQNLENDMSLVRDLVREVRATRSQYRVEPGKFVEAVIVAGEHGPFLASLSGTIARLARLHPLKIVARMDRAPNDSASILVGDATVFLPLSDLTDPAAERMRLEKELEQTQQAHRAARAKLENDSFIARAPEHVVTRERARATSLQDRVERLRERLEALST